MILAKVGILVLPDGHGILAIPQYRLGKKPLTVIPPVAYLGFMRFSSAYVCCCPHSDLLVDRTRV
jgi:hypothetical protein